MLPHFHGTLKVEVLDSSQTFVTTCQTPWCHIPQHSNLHSHHCENFTFNVFCSRCNLLKGRSSRKMSDALDASVIVCLFILLFIHSFIHLFIYLFIVYLMIIPVTQTTVKFQLVCPYLVNIFSCSSWTKYEQCIIFLYLVNLNFVNIPHLV
jgi:hypothetical protein